MIELLLPIEVLGKTATHCKLVNELVDSEGQEILVTDLYQMVENDEGEQVPELVYEGVAFIKGSQPYNIPQVYTTDQIMAMTVGELDAVHATLTPIEGWASMLKAEKQTALIEVL